MNASFTLIESNIDKIDNNVNRFENGSDKYELLFKIKTELYEVEILKLDCYIKNGYITVNTHYGFKGSLYFFIRKFKNFLNGINNNIKSEINFLCDCDFTNGLIYNENNVISTIYEEPDLSTIIPKMDYIIKYDDKFLSDLETIIEQLNTIK